MTTDLPPIEPATPAEWQECVDIAYAFRLLEDARLYGLVTGGPEVIVDRCDDILTRGAALGIAPSQDAIERVLAPYMRPPVLQFFWQAVALRGQQLKSVPASLRPEKRK